MNTRARSSLIAFAAIVVCSTSAHAQQGWTVYGGDPGNTRYSSLTQINPSNVKNLKVAWVLQLGSLRSQESTPLVIGDTLYVTSSHGPKNVFAVDAKTGNVRWRYSPEVPAGIDQYACCDVNNRGVAYSNGRIFVGRLDGAMVALDATTLTFLVISSLAAALIARLRSIVGTFLAAMAIGLIHDLLTPIQSLSNYRDMTPFVLAAVALLVLSRHRVMTASREEA
jgi:glucose dehydrogenase